MRTFSSILIGLFLISFPFIFLNCGGSGSSGSSSSSSSLSSSQGVMSSPFAGLTTSTSSSLQRASQSSTALPSNRASLKALIDALLAINSGKVSDDEGGIMIRSLHQHRDVLFGDDTWSELEDSVYANVRKH